MSSVNTKTPIFRRVSFISLGVLLLSLLLSACGSSATNTPVAPVATTAPAGAATTAPAGAATTAAGAATANTSVSGNVRIAIAPSSPAEDAIVDQQLANFAKAYPNVKVSKEVIASDYLTKIQTLIAGGNPPDVFYVDSLPARDLIEDKVLEPLNTLADKYKVNAGDFYPNLIKAYTGTDGKLYGLPKDHNTLVMFYSKEMFQKAGITAVPKTWEEFRAAAEKLKAVAPADGAAIVAEPAIERILPWIYQAGGTLLTDDLKTSKVTDAAFKKGMEFYYNLRKDGFSKKSSEVGADWPGDALIKGKAGVVFEGGWLIPAADKAGVKDKIGIAEMPKGETQGTLDFTVAYVMAAKSQNKDAAFALLSFMTSESQQRLLSDAGLALPSRKALTEPFVAKFPERKPLVDATNYARAWQFGVGFGAFADKANPSIQGLFSGSKNIDQVVSDIDKQVKEALANK
jgi:multiple sugar transport system substrate-binding protein